MFEVVGLKRKIPLTGNRIQQTAKHLLFLQGWEEGRNLHSANGSWHFLEVAASEAEQQNKWKTKTERVEVIAVYRLLLPQLLQCVADVILYDSGLTLEGKQRDNGWQKPD